MVERSTTLGLFLAVVILVPLAAALPGAVSTIPTTNLTSASTSTTTTPTTTVPSPTIASPTVSTTTTTAPTTTAPSLPTAPTTPDPGTTAPLAPAPETTLPAVATTTDTIAVASSTLAELLQPESDMVGFEGEFPASIMLALSVDVKDVHADAGFAIVTTRAPGVLHALADVMPGLTYVVRNGETRAEGASWDAATWDASHWDAASWDGASWDAATWDASQWDAASWDAASWDAASWDAASWDAAHWDAASWDATSWDAKSATMDPGYPHEWHLGAIHAPDAWRTTIARHTITICVADSGVDYTHPDLAANMKRAGNGSYGRDFANGDGDPMDDGGHGTAMAGLAAAVMGNGHGIAGVSQAWIQAEKVLDAQGHGTEANLALGIRACVDTGAKIVLLALHTEQDNPGVHDAVKYAAKKGALVVAASGNAGQVCDACVAFPAAYNEALAVGATSPNGTRASFSNGGKALDLLAPGVQVPAPWPGAQYVVGSGTSQASAITAGAAALAWATHPGMSAQDVRDALVENTKDVGAVGFDQATGNGLLRLDLAFADLVG